MPILRVTAKPLIGPVPKPNSMIAAIMLFGFGTGPIKGFAVTLSIGIMTSMFTAVTGSRALVNLLYGGRKLQTLSV